MREVLTHPVVRAFGYIVALVIAIPIAARAADTSAAMALIEVPIFLLIVGSIGYLISRLRHKDRTWVQVVFGHTAIISTILLLMVSGAGQS